VTIQPWAKGQRFQLILIKPSHYDDDGYVIRWWRAMIPSNSLAALYGIAADCAQRQVLGPDVSLDIDAIDEMNARIDIPRLIARIHEHAGFGLVALVGVQSNQYPRALDIAQPFREAGIQVAIGGFHVSGCLSMLDGSAVELNACREMGIAMFAGEAEGRFEGVLRDAAAGQLQPVYNFLKDLPGLEATPEPILPARYVQRTLGRATSFDAGRGCPYQCSFCTIINVQGRKSRSRSPDDVERLVRANWAQGINNHHRRQFRPQQGLGSDLRPVDRTQGRPRHPTRPADPGRYIVPQDPQLRGKGQACRGHARVHRTGKRQPRQPDGSEEAPEQD
jgi:hypothetical protein